MQCERAHDFISADLDGELSPVEHLALNEHLSTCRSCQAEQANLMTLHRMVRLQRATAVPDLTEAILAKAHPPSAGRHEWVRFALAVVALTQLVLALPALLLGEDGNAPVHIARHVGSLTIALAVGLVYAAWRPVRAYGLLPIATALAGCMVLTSLIDLADGRVRVVAEAHHLLDLAGLLLLWVLAGAPVPRGRRHASHALGS